MKMIKILDKNLNILWRGGDPVQARRMIKEIQDNGKSIIVYDQISPRESPFKRIW